MIVPSKKKRKAVVSFTEAASAVSRKREREKEKERQSKAASEEF